MPVMGTYYTCNPKGGGLTNSLHLHDTHRADSRYSRYCDVASRSTSSDCEMGPGVVNSNDFLKIEQETPLQRGFLVCGTEWAICTNSELVLLVAGSCFAEVHHPARTPVVRAKIWIDPAPSEPLPASGPYVRGLGHLVFAGFDSYSSALVDLETLRIAGRFSAGTAADSDRWTSLIFPVLVSVVAGALGAAEIHGACVANGGNGCLLIGPSCSGKSTLSLALAKLGHGFLSDDRTLCSVRSGQLLASGLGTPLKLRTDASHWFSELKETSPNAVLQGENVFRFDPSRHFGVNRIRECQPRALIFLERSSSPGFHLTDVPRDEAISQLETDLVAEPYEIEEKQRATIEKLMELPRWRLSYGGHPQSVAERLAQHLENV